MKENEERERKGGEGGKRWINIFIGGYAREPGLRRHVPDGLIVGEEGSNVAGRNAVLRSLRCETIPSLPPIWSGLPRNEGEKPWNRVAWELENEGEV